MAGGLIIGERPTLAGSIGALVVLIGMGLVLWETGYDHLMPARMPFRPLAINPRFLDHHGRTPATGCLARGRAIT